MSTSDLFVDRVFDAAIGQPSEAKWAVGITLLTDVLLGCGDELERERLINGLWRELRAALDIAKDPECGFFSIQIPKLPELPKNGTQMTELGL